MYYLLFNILPSPIPKKHSGNPDSGQWEASMPAGLGGLTEVSRQAFAEDPTNLHMHKPRFVCTHPHTTAACTHTRSCGTVSVCQSLVHLWAPSQPRQFRIPALVQTSLSDNMEQLAPSTRDALSTGDKVSVNFG